YWAGTMSLVVFALAEAILFAWIFGLRRGWPELLAGADIKVPVVFKYIMIYITPILLLIVFLGSLFLPEGGDWAGALQNMGNGWQLDNGSIIRMLQNSGIKETIANATDPDQVLMLRQKMNYINAARILLVSLFAGISILVYVAYTKRKKSNLQTPAV
ncbi:MAG: sodium:calcium symporter, partial [Owenweeksia sp.]